jgi:hypothetical protein
MIQRRAQRDRPIHPDARPGRALSPSASALGHRSARTGGPRTAGPSTPGTAQAHAVASASAARRGSARCHPSLDEIRRTVRRYRRLGALGSPRGNADTSHAPPLGSDTPLGYTRGRRAGMHRAPVQPQVDELTVGVVDRARWYAAVRAIGRMSRFKKRKLHVEQGGKIALLSVGARVADGRARGRGRARRRAQCEPGCPGTRRTPRGLPVNGTDIESGPLRKRSFGVRLSNTRAALRRAVEEGRPTSLASSAASRERAEIAQCRKRVRPYARTE